MPICASKSRSARRAAFAAAPAAAACCLLCGCYKHVVGASGPAARNFEVQDANVSKDDTSWSVNSSRPVEVDRYSSPTTLDNARPAPKKSTRNPG